MSWLLPGGRVPCARGGQWLCDGRRVTQSPPLALLAASSDSLHPFPPHPPAGLLSQPSTSGTEAAAAAPYSSSTTTNAAQERRRRRRQQQAEHQRRQQSAQPQAPAAAPQRLWGPPATAPPLGRVASAAAPAWRQEDGDASAAGQASWLHQLMLDATGGRAPADSGAAAPKQQQQQPAALPSPPSVAPSSRFALEAMADCRLPTFLAYSRAARHGAPTALDAGATRPAGRAARLELLRRERALRAVERQVAKTGGSGGGGNGGGVEEALLQLSEAQVERAAAAAGVGRDEIEQAVYDYFVFKR